MNPLNLFSKSTETETYAAGETIFRQGDHPGKHLYVIQQGEIDIQANGITIDTVGEGSILGEMALIDSSPRSATAVAKSDCELIPVDEKRFTFLVQQTPFFALHVMRVLAERLRKTNALLRGPGAA